MGLMSALTGRSPEWRLRYKQYKAAIKATKRAEKARNAAYASGHTTRIPEAIAKVEEARVYENAKKEAFEAICEREGE